MGLRPRSTLSVFFFSTCDSTVSKSRGAALSTLTSCTIGRLQQEQQLRVQLGLARQRRSSVTSAALIARPCTTAALICSAGAVLANVVSVLASATGSLPV